MTRSSVVARYDAIRERLAALEEELSELEADAQDYYDARTERWQDSENGQRWQEMVDEIGEAQAQLQDLAGTELP